MRLLLIIVATLWASSAWAAATLKVVSDRPVVISVNMIPHTVGEASPAKINLRDPGNQRVTVRNLLGQQLWSGVVMAPANTDTVAKWNGADVVVTDTTPSTSMPVPQARRPRTGAKLQDLADDSGVIYADQQLLDLAALQVEDAPTATADEGEPAPLAEASVPTSPAPAPAPYEGRSLYIARQGATLMLVSRESSWSNVKLDGHNIWEYRGKDRTLRVILPPGPHQLAFWDFQDKRAWAAGTVLVDESLPVEIRFGMSTGAQAFQNQPAWTPTP